MIQTKSFLLKLTDDEKNKLEAMASEKNVSMSQYIKDELFKESTDSKRLAETLHDLKIYGYTNHKLLASLIAYVITYFEKNPKLDVKPTDKAIEYTRELISKKISEAEEIFK